MHKSSKAQPTALQGGGVDVTEMEGRAESKRWKTSQAFRSPTAQHSALRPDSVSATPVF